MITEGRRQRGSRRGSPGGGSGQGLRPTAVEEGEGGGGREATGGGGGGQQGGGKGRNRSATEERAAEESQAGRFAPQEGKAAQHLSAGGAWDLTTRVGFAPTRARVDRGGLER